MALIQACTIKVSSNTRSLIFSWTFWIGYKQQSRLWLHGIVWLFWKRQVVIILCSRKISNEVKMFSRLLLINQSIITAIALIKFLSPKSGSFLWPLYCQSFSLISSKCTQVSFLYIFAYVDDDCWCHLMSSSIVLWQAADLVNNER